ncbi:nickel-dependent hydrogenase large subunit [Methanosarcina barkeri]|uniref:nickel-dependent hydrogenase large subunit n=1 Tax=Methanosarcina barkeri TaxID=2208 RepID=UPI000A4CE712|nr:nickel-dependent hydrogenase large subunit [Methanosarcina barkeri]
MQHQDPRDAAFLTQRICGVCPLSHGLTATNALDDLYGVAESVPKDALMMRNIFQGLNMVASHATHIYVLFGPDLANPAYKNVLTTLGDTGNAVWKEMVGRFAPISYKMDGVAVPAGSSYLAAIPEKKRLAEMIALIAGRMPGPSALYPGGYTYPATVADVTKLASYYLQIMDFVSKHTLRVDFDTWIKNTYKASSPQKAVSFVTEHLQGLVDKSTASNDFSKDAGWGDVEFYAAFGSELVGEQILGLPASLKHDTIGGYKDPSKICFVAYGGYYKYKDGYDPRSPAGDRIFTSGVVSGNLEYQKFDPDKITESTAHSFYQNSSNDLAPTKGETVPFTDPNKIVYTGGSDSQYSWDKAPRYDGIAGEVGPLARMLNIKEPLVTGLAQALNEKGYSAANVYTRMLARMQETAILAYELLNWVTVDYNPNGKISVPIDLNAAKNNSGMGIWEAPRGALGHWISAGSDGKVTNYQCIVPGSWLMSPRDSKGIPGPLEQSLIGSKINQLEMSIIPIQLAFSIWVDPMILAFHVQSTPLT